MLEHGVDQIVLGCTHYPFFKPQIEEMVGDNVTVIDPAPAVARRVNDVLTEQGLQNSDNHDGSDVFVSSGDVGTMQTLLTSMNRKEYHREMLLVGDNQYESLR